MILILNISVWGFSHFRSEDGEEKFNFIVFAQDCLPLDAAADERNDDDEDKEEQDSSSNDDDDLPGEWWPGDWGPGHLSTAHGLTLQTVWSSLGDEAGPDDQPQQLICVQADVVRV